MDGDGLIVKFASKEDILVTLGVLDLPKWVLRLELLDVGVAASLLFRLLGFEIDFLLELGS